MKRLKRLIAKALRVLLQPPAITACSLDRTAKICSGSQVNKSQIGRYTYVGHDCFLLRVNIGGFASIADGCRIGGHTHSMDRVSTSPVFEAGKNVLKKNFAEFEPCPTPVTTIGADVWIGANTTIISGVSIGVGAVVGAGSVVTHDIPAYEIWAGNPARKIKDRFDKETVEKLLKSEWWSLPDSEIQRLAAKFDDVSAFIKER